MKPLTPYESAEKFYDLFFLPEHHWTIREYLDNSFCDAIVEVNLKKGSYQFLFRLENKYYPPTEVGNFNELYQFTSSTVVHPDDLDIYVDLMDPEHLMERLNASSRHHFRFAQFRYKLADGRYRYVEQAILTGKENGFKDDVFRLYVFDIQNCAARALGLTESDTDLIEKSRNPITGLFDTTAFFAKANAYLHAGLRQKKNLCLFTLDVEHFRLFDEWFGREQGDFMLTRFGALLNDLVETHGGVAGYFGGDDFVYLGPYDEERIKMVYKMADDLVSNMSHAFVFRPAIGIYLIQKGDNIKDAVDRAESAERRAKKDLTKRIHLFDLKLHQQSEADYRTIVDFMRALENGEITFYLQPQCRTSTKNIVGAEALCRWVKPDGSKVPPNLFIPALERYGFVTTLDRYLWDKVCAWLREWLDKGNCAVPISVNVSRVDILTIDIVKEFTSLCEKYSLDPGYIKIEITESAYAESSAEANALVQKLQSLGFLVLMDDFGSGYSSLNILGSLNINAIKLDGFFLDSVNRNMAKGMRIIESTINMAKNMALPVIVEGVEDQKQLDYLVSLGVRYVQGYYFYKPMPIEEFEKLISNREILDTRGFVAKSNEQFRMREFLDENIYSDAMLNTILGPTAIYLWKDERLDIIRYNQQFYETVDEREFSDRLEHIERFTPEADRPLLYHLLSSAKENRLNGSSGYIHFQKANGIITTYLMHFYYLSDVPEGSRFYGSVRNVTEIADLRQEMDIIASSISDSIIFMKKREGHWQFKVVAHGLADITGLSAIELQKELDTRDFWKRVQPRSFHSIVKRSEEAFSQKKGFSFSFTMRGAHGQWITLELTADTTDKIADNVDYILTFRHRK